MTPLAARWDSARLQTDALFDVLNPEALYQRPVAERHRLIFYLGHVEAFDWNLIGRGALNRPSFHPSFDKLFAFGIDPEPGRAPSDRPADWPSEKEVRAYGNRVRQELDEAAADVPEEAASTAWPRNTGSCTRKRSPICSTICLTIRNSALRQRRPPQVRPAIQ